MDPLPGDYHIHTTFSDGADAVERCVCRAVELGLPEIGIADHFAFEQASLWDAAHMTPERLPAYIAGVREAAGRAEGVTVLLGLEADYVPEHEGRLRDLLATRPFDYVIGGLHAIDGFEFDHPGLRDHARWQDPGALMAAYYRRLRQAAASGCFDVLAHLDYIGLWGHRPDPAVVPLIDAALDAMAAAGVAVELNTDWRSDPAGVMYPSGEILRGARERGIPLVLDSDAHRAADVGRFWSEAMETARAAGYTHTLRLSDRASVALPR
jgi:histidinol-phosphatase (PHP family)